MADGRATKIFMPTDLSGVVSSLGLLSESTGLGDATPIDRSAKPAKAPEADPCITDATSAEGRLAADVTSSIIADLEDRR